jgi:hypothetical protein
MNNQAVMKPQIKYLLILFGFQVLATSCNESEPEGFETSFIGIELSNITDQADCSLNP